MSGFTPAQVSIDLVYCFRSTVNSGGGEGGSKLPYSKTCLKRPLKKNKTKVRMANDSLMNVESFAECSNTFDLHSAIIGLEN